MFIGRTDAEAETPILWAPDVKSRLIGKDPDAGKDWRREEKGMIEDEMVGWHHRLNGHGFGWTLGVGWWTGRPGVLWFMGLQRVRHDWASELNHEIERFGYKKEGSHGYSLRHMWILKTLCKVRDTNSWKVMKHMIYGKRPVQANPQRHTTVLQLRGGRGERGKSREWWLWGMGFLCGGTENTLKIKLWRWPYSYVSTLFFLLSRVRLFCDPLDCSPARLLRLWDSPGKNPGVGCHFLLPGNRPDPGIKPPSPAGGFFTTEPSGKFLLYPTWLQRAWGADAPQPPVTKRIWELAAAPGTQNFLRGGLWSKPGPTHAQGSHMKEPSHSLKGSRVQQHQRVRTKPEEARRKKMDPQQDDVLCGKSGHASPG